MEPPSPSQAQAHTRMQQRVVYETACALAESTTLVEAAPRGSPLRKASAYRES